MFCSIIEGLKEAISGEFDRVKFNIFDLFFVLGQYRDGVLDCFKLFQLWISGIELALTVWCRPGSAHYSSIYQTRIRYTSNESK
ncbi:unnamed protein product, partial [Rotaria magnacalcarata]